MADNCTDNTFDVAVEHNAVAYSRESKDLVGKGYAMEALLKEIKRDFPEGFDGYFVFDADNILTPNYIEEMHKCHLQGNEAITSYRNSKNFGDNWISSGYSLCFLRESMYLNYPRYKIGSSAAISGTGFFRVVQRADGRWWAIDPLGRGVVLMGVDHVRYGGHWSQLQQHRVHIGNHRGDQHGRAGRR